MKYQNDMSNYLKDGFAVPEFADYTKQCLAKLAQEIKAPCYAVEGEQNCLDRLHKHINANPYRWFESRFNLAAEQIEMRKAKSLTRLSDPLAYACIQDACAALKISYPSAFTFAQDTETRYDAKAMRHMDMMWLFISEHFRENEILSDLELCFVVGRVLGEAVAYHAEVAETQDLTPEQYRAQVLTADRAGFLAVLWHAVRMYPSMSADELVHKAADVSAQTIHKLDILCTLKKNQSAVPQLLQQKMEKSPIREKHAKKNERMPTVWERIDALQQFAVSITFVRCISTLWGESHLIVQSYSGAGMLQKNMSHRV